MAQTDQNKNAGCTYTTFTRHSTAKKKVATLKSGKAFKQNNTTVYLSAYLLFYTSQEGGCCQKVLDFRNTVFVYVRSIFGVHVKVL